MKPRHITLLLVLLISAITHAAKGLSASECSTLRSRIIAEWKASQRPHLLINEKDHTIRQGDLVMRYWYHGFGKEPVDGRSLYISMHGGGGTPKAVNDQQWENQKQLYQPREGVYLTPRAPWDAWNMWFQEPIDAMFEELIRTMVVLYNVNPDKVYLMGYSAGGDGVWRLAPRMADHWAAAAMMAGHPGDVSLLNVRNLPFTLWCGANDAAYNRNKEVAKRGTELDSLQQADPQGYIHECHILEGKPHWMDSEDVAAVPWMAQYRRNAYPKHIIWQQEEVLRPFFYWLQVSKEEMKRGKKVVVNVEGNTINIQQCDYKQLTLLLNDEILDLDKTVRIVHNKKTLFKGKINRTEECLHRTLEQRGDPSFVFPSSVTVKL